MNHKRRRSKTSRAGCLFCKPHKHPRVSKRRASKASVLKKIDSAEATRDE